MEKYRSQVSSVDGHALPLLFTALTVYPFISNCSGTVIDWSGTTLHGGGLSLRHIEL